MKKCCICGADITKENPPILFIGDNNDFKELCNNCAEIMESAYDSNIDLQSPEISRRIKNISDEEVKSFLTDTFPKIKELYSDSNGTQTEGGSGYAPSDILISRIKQCDNIWIKGLKIFAWLIFFSIIMAGIVFGVGVRHGIGFFIFLFSVILAFLCVAGIMVFLGIASDISTMRKLLENQIKK